MRPLHFLYLPLLLLACGSPDSQNTGSAPSDLDGKALSQTYCASCHIYTGPEMLTQYTWKNFILPRMGAFMGIFHDGTNYYESLPPEWVEPGIGGKLVLEGNVYPDQPMLSHEDWEKIQSYYLENAPEQLIPAQTQAIHPELAHFRSHPLLKAGFYAAYTQEVVMDTARSEILVSLFEQDVIRIDLQGQVKAALGYNDVVTDIDLDANGLTLTGMGNRDGLDEPIGTLRRGESLKSMARAGFDFQLDSLQRPIESAWADLDQDGLEDVVIAEFGNYVGKLAWYKQTAGGKLEKHVLYPVNGAMKVIIAELTGDLLPDIVALMGNGDEGVDLYRNEGQGQFSRQRLLRFPPTYGSTDFELVDFDQDGKQDILYVNGDNGDYPAILKPHHGIRLFKNEGNLQFKESFYLPLNGAYQARSGDFDLDGDFDLVSVAYHPDYRNPPTESFVYWEQKVPGSFAAYTLPDFDHARWMRLDVGDLDRDGDLDVVLGGFNARAVETPAELVNHWDEESVPVLWLENTIDKKR
jgi:hypothetical protein